jgi:spore coat protein U-like protein
MGKMMKILNLLLFVLGVGMLPVSSYAGILNANTQTTATVGATCTIVAQNLNFGALTLPLSSQTASTSMSVLCSKSHAYTVGLAYGGVYGSGGGSGTAYGTVIKPVLVMVNPKTVQVITIQFQPILTVK